MLDAVLALAVLCAGCAALRGSRTALALLAGTALEMGLSVVGVPFNPPGWMAIDAIVALSILIPPRTTTDKLVVALFGPAWVFYYIPGDAGYAGSVIVTSAQLLLSVPWMKLGRRLRSIHLPENPFDHFDLRARHEGVT